MWKDLGNYLLKLSLLILGAMVIYPFTHKEFDLVVGTVGLITYGIFLISGISALKKHYQEKRGGRNDKQSAQ